MNNSGNKFYKIEYLETAEEDLPLLSKNIKKTIQNAIEERLVVDPIRLRKPFCSNFKGYRSLHIGDYRVVYKISEEKRTGFILTIKHRSYVYQEIH